MMGFALNAAGSTIRRPSVLAVTGIEDTWRHGLLSIEVIEHRWKMAAEMRRIRREMRALART